MCYNSIVKRLVLLTTALLTALCLTGGISAYADEATDSTMYPLDESFIKSPEFTSLTDYAVAGDTYAFGEGSKVSVFSGGKLTEYVFESDVDKLDSDEGVIYCEVDGQSYTLPDKEQCEFKLKDSLKELTIGEYFHYTLIDTTLKISDYRTDRIHTFEGSYSNLKQFDEVLYVMSDNDLYEIRNDSLEKVELHYADYSETQKIKTGNTASLLKDYELKFVTIEKGAYVTEIELTTLNGEYFDTIQTTVAEEEKTALLLCYTGNAALVSIGDQAYILLKSKTKEIEPEGVDEREFDAQIQSNRIYASPFSCEATTASTVVNGQIVKVKRTLTNKVLQAVYCEVEYTSGESTATGYVAYGLLKAEIIKDYDTPTTHPDPEFNDGTSTKTVLLIFAVVVLVLIALGYLTYVGTSGKNRKKKKDKKAKANKQSDSEE